MTHCAQCGTQTAAGLAFCEACGGRLAAAAPSPSPARRGMPAWTLPAVALVAAALAGGSVYLFRSHPVAVMPPQASASTPAVPAATDGAPSVAGANIPTVAPQPTTAPAPGLAKAPAPPKIHAVSASHLRPAPHPAPVPSAAPLPLPPVLPPPLPPAAPPMHAAAPPLPPNRLPLAPAPVAPAPSTAITVPTNTTLRASLDQGVSTKTAKFGDVISATLAAPVVVGSATALPAGSKLQGTVEQSKRGGLLGGHGVLQLAFKSVLLPSGATLPLQLTMTGAGATAVSQSEGTATSSGSSAARDSVAGGAASAVLGGIFGGGKGAVGGGAAGAGAGLALGAFTAKRDVVLPPGTILVLRLDAPIQVTPH